ncbi:hypothetical protein NQ317_018418 [Molorchus minor]|uniref:Peptidase aspartic putative domain-containing protein n=1 Tax=Molorchus minor TaxID=1323400 RepID=A0ABQ9JRE4_9CUCU|nr:hypothetical protein NQ317_018418 [Molorchus minor]
MDLIFLSKFDAQTREHNQIRQWLRFCKNLEEGMEKLVKGIDVHRTSFLRLYNATEKLLINPGRDIFEIQASLQNMKKKIEILEELNKQVVDFLIDNDSVETDIDEEVEKTDELVNKFTRLKLQVENLVNKENAVDLVSQWLPFWSQFKRIHEDDHIENEDKFQYLIQATFPNSRARQLVESYPPSSENYLKVIESLKSRFGREDLLVEVYVRELLKLIFNNLNSKCNLSSLYDKLESQLRALETLNVSSDKCSAMLYPLVESCLPEEILRAWQRNTCFNLGSSLKDRLEKLMEFLKKEVESEERIALAASGFGWQRQKKQEETKTIALPATASGLKDHKSEDCRVATNLPLAEKRKILYEKGCCHLCLKFGHIARKCRTASKLRCTVCEGKHASIVCPRNAEEKRVSTSAQNIPVNDLSNFSYNQVFLQTVMVNLVNGKKALSVRVIFDLGSQRSYISSRAVLDMSYKHVRYEEIVHALFGGYTTEPVRHGCYKIQLQNLDNSYACSFEALDQPTICSHLDSVEDGTWTRELEKLKIKITDSADIPIDVLIGADVGGKLFTGKRYLLECGLVAMETSLGWTLWERSNMKMFLDLL